MSETIVVIAKTRSDEGKGASRRLRRLEGLMPAVVYGGSKDPASISIEHKEMLKFIENEAFFSSVLSLEIDGAAEQVVIKDLQRHPAKEQLLHADFLRVDASTVLHKNVPLHFINEESCVGVKTQGGKIQHVMSEVEVSCTADKLPEYIEVDMAEVEAGTTLHISDLKLPEGVSSVQLALGASHDLSVVIVSGSAGGASEEESE